MTDRLKHAETVFLSKSCHTLDGEHTWFAVRFKNTLKTTNNRTKEQSYVSSLLLCETSVNWKQFWQLQVAFMSGGPQASAPPKESPACCCPAPKRRSPNVPPLFVLVIVNNWEELPMINNIALTSTPLTWRILPLYWTKFPVYEYIGSFSMIHCILTMYRKVHVCRAGV